MGKTSRASKHSAKMQRKRAVKAARRTLYASLAGTSKKSKNQKRRVRISSGAKHSHKMADCGNAGCVRCNPLKRPLLPGCVGLGKKIINNSFVSV